MRRPAALALLVLAVSASSAARADESDACVSAAEESQPLRRNGKLRLARGKLLLCSRAACPAVVATDCGTWLAEVENAMATVLLRVKEEGGQDVVDARVLVDGEAAEPDAEGVLFLEPGKHAIRVERGGSSPFRADVTVRAGERRRPVDVVLHPLPGATPVALAPTTSERPAPILPWVLGATGVVAIGAGTALWVVGRGDYARLRDSCGVTASCAASDVSEVKTKLQIGDVVFGVGVLAASAGLYLALSAPSSGTGAALRVQPTAHGAAVVYSAELR